jgi:hypothetical protein
VVKVEDRSSSSAVLGKIDVDVSDRTELSTIVVADVETDGVEWVKLSVFVVSTISIDVSLVDNNAVDDDCAEVIVMMFCVEIVVSAVVSAVFVWAADVLISSYVSVVE